LSPEEGANEVFLPSQFGDLTLSSNVTL